MRKKILFICGSLNQTTMMHQIALQLPEHGCYFTPFFAEGLIAKMSEWKLLEHSILGGRHRWNTQRYLLEQGLPVDFGGRQNDYDLVVTCTDLIVQRSIRGKKLVLVQEGITEAETLAYHLVKRLQLPRYLANTSATGLSNAYDYFCVASRGYRDLFIRKGVRRDKLVVTGIPNYDHVGAYCQNDFPLRHYVLAATSSTRETGRWDNRLAFLLKVRRIAAGRQILFKLHPNEHMTRARWEIHQVIPEALIYEDGNINHMIANCDVFITQTSTATFVGLALGKEVHTDLNLEELRRLMPMQNGGKSAASIAKICYRMLDKRSFTLRPAVNRPWRALTGQNAADAAP